jgi:D-aminopeptidase
MLTGFDISVNSGKHLDRLAEEVLRTNAMSGSLTRVLRARDLGVPFDGVAGPTNTFTDVPGVRVGHLTLRNDDASGADAGGVARTGVTGVIPAALEAGFALFAGGFVLNGAGEFTGWHLIEEVGILAGPIVLTNTYGVGAAHEGVLRWSLSHFGETALSARSLPVVAETWDGALNDVGGFHVRPDHVAAALDAATGAPVEEGAVGGGTGMMCYQFKGGIGTASRLVEAAGERYVLSALVQANHGERDALTIAGAPIGRLVRGLMPDHDVRSEADGAGSGSIVILIATNAPLSPHQLKRVARRGALGLARTGSIAGTGSGDFMLAFSTAHQLAPGARSHETARFLSDLHINPLFTAAIQATEEAIVNALVTARTMTGAAGRTVHALPHDVVRRAMSTSNRRGETS